MSNDDDIYHATVCKKPENELLLCCAHRYQSQANIIKIKQLTHKDLDWQYVLINAKTHGVMPLLFWNLNQICPQQVPVDTLSILSKFYLLNKKRNSFLSNQLVNLITLFQYNNINCLPFKGPTLAILLHRNVGLRQCGDLDIYVDKADVIRTVDLLRANNYVCASIANSQNDLEKLISEYYECTLINEKSNLIVDLHWNFSNNEFPFIVESNSLWERAGTVLINNYGIMSLNLEDLLLYLCVHGSKHYWSKLSWLSDIADLIQTYPHLINNHVIQQAKKRGYNRMLAIALVLASKLLDVPINGEIIKKISNTRKIQLLAFKVGQSLFTDEVTLLSTYNDMYYCQHIKGKLTQRLVYAIQKAKDGQAKDKWLFPLTACLSIVYYMTLPFWLSYKFIRLRFQYNATIGNQ